MLKIPTILGTSLWFHVIFGSPSPNFRAVKNSFLCQILKSTKVTRCEFLTTLSSNDNNGKVGKAYLFSLRASPTSIAMYEKLSMNTQFHLPFLCFHCFCVPCSFVCSLSKRRRPRRQRAHCFVLNH